MQSVLITIHEDTFEAVLRRGSLSPEDVEAHHGAGLVSVWISLPVFTTLLTFDTDMDIAIRQALDLPPRITH